MSNSRDEVEKIHSDIKIQKKKELQKVMNKLLMVLKRSTLTACDILPSCEYPKLGSLYSAIQKYEFDHPRASIEMIVKLGDKRIQLFVYNEETKVSKREIFEDYEVNSEFLDQFDIMIKEQNQRETEINDILDTLLREE